MKKHFFVFLLLFIAFGAFCKSKKADKSEAEKVPLWMTDEGRSRLFPSDQFLSAFAFSGTAEGAKNKATEQLSEYIKSHVESSVNYSLSDENSSVTQNSSIQTDNLLFCTEYTVPYYSASYGMFCVTSYIERSKAFNHVKPKLDSALNTFPSEYEKAVLIEDTFEKVVGLNKALERLSAFYEVYDFACAVSPNSATKYRSVDELSRKAQAELTSLCSEVVVKIESEGDSDGRFKSALASVFSEIGFSVSESNCAKYKCTLKVELENGQKTEQTVEIFPSYSLEICSAEKITFGTTHKLSKVVGFDKSGAERKAKRVIENDIKNELKKEL